MHELLKIISKIKDACEAYERIEASADWAVNQIIDLVAPVDTTEVE